MPTYTTNTIYNPDYGRYVAFDRVEPIYTTTANTGTSFTYENIREEVKKIISKAIGETLRELKIKITEEDFLAVLEEKIDV